MTKLFSRAFASSPEDTKIDRDISEKIHLLQNFLKPEHLDIPLVLQNEASWLVCMLASYIFLEFFKICIDALFIRIVYLILYRPLEFNPPCFVFDQTLYSQFCLFHSDVVIGVYLSCVSQVNDLQPNFCFTHVHINNVTNFENYSTSVDIS